MISLIVDGRLWFHSVIQTGDLPSFLQIFTDTDVIVISLEDSGKTFVYVFFYSILKSVLLAGLSLGHRQLYLLHAFTPISGSGLKPTILFEYHGSCLCSSKTK